MCTNEHVRHPTHWRVGGGGAGPVFFFVDEIAASLSAHSILFTHCANLPSCRANTVPTDPQNRSTLYPVSPVLRPPIFCHLSTVTFSFRQIIPSFDAALTGYPLYCFLCFPSVLFLFSRLSHSPQLKITAGTAVPVGTGTSCAVLD